MPRKNEQFNPLHAIGILSQETDNAPLFLGTCFSFKDSKCFVTAAHCIDNGNEGLSIVMPRLVLGNDVIEVHRHPCADIAICVTDNRWEGSIIPFSSVVGNYGLGEEFLTNGYPKESPYMGEVLPTERLFVGHYQRFFEHQRGGFSYLAGELNIPCPGGLSGAPLFRRDAPQVVTGVVSDNLEVSTELREEEVTKIENSKETYIYKRVINYGIAVMLHEVIDWMDEVIENYPNNI